MPPVWKDRKGKDVVGAKKAIANVTGHETQGTDGLKLQADLLPD